MVHFCCLYSFTWSLGSITVGQEAVILTFTLNFFVNVTLHSEGKLSGALWRQGGKRKLSLQLRLCIKKSGWEMLIGGDDISNDVVTPWQMLFNVCLYLPSFPFRHDWRKSDSSVDGEPQGNWRWNSNSRGLISSKCPLLFPPRRQNAPESLLAG